MLITTSHPRSMINKMRLTRSSSTSESSRPSRGYRLPIRTLASIWTKSKSVSSPGLSSLAYTANSRSSSRTRLRSTRSSLSSTPTRQSTQLRDAKNVVCSTRCASRSTRKTDRLATSGMRSRTLRSVQSSLGTVSHSSPTTRMMHILASCATITFTECLQLNSAA